MIRKIQDLIYVISWTGGLLIGAFPKILEENFLSNLWLQKDFGTIYASFIFPMSMAMILFIVDVIYQIFRTTQLQKNEIVLCLMFFLGFWICTMLPIGYENANKTVFFYIAWIMLFFMKYTTILYSDQQSIPKGDTPNGF